MVHIVFYNTFYHTSRFIFWYWSHIGELSQSCWVFCTVQDVMVCELICMKSSLFVIPGCDYTYRFLCLNINIFVTKILQQSAISETYFKQQGKWCCQTFIWYKDPRLCWWNDPSLSHLGSLSVVNCTGQCDNWATEPFSSNFGQWPKVTIMSESLKSDNYHSIYHE